MIFFLNEEVYELVLSWFLLINLQPFFKRTCGTNDRLKTYFTNEKRLPKIGGGDEDAQNNKKDPYGSMNHVQILNDKY